MEESSDSEDEERPASEAEEKLDPVVEDANAEVLASEPVENDNQKASDE